MALEQTEQIKQQIINQIESTFPEDKKNSAIEQIEAMDDSELENFLIQNNLIKTSEGGEEKCIFCSIASEKIPGYKIFENDLAIAVLEINPISRGHSLVIPKEHVQEISKEIKEFAKELSINLKEILSAKEIHTEDSEMFGHKIIKIIPVYDDKTLKEKTESSFINSSSGKSQIKEKSQPAPKNILEDLQVEILEKIESKKQKVIQEKEEQKKPEVITDKNTWLPRRIP